MFLETWVMEEPYDSAGVIPNIITFFSINM